MKRFFALLMALFLSATLFGCNHVPSTEVSDTSDSEVPHSDSSPTTSNPNYTEDASDVNTGSLFGSMQITDISQSDISQ